MKIKLGMFVKKTSTNRYLNPERIPNNSTKEA